MGTRLLLDFLKSDSTALFCTPYGRRVGEYMYIFQIICLYWIYATNNWNWNWNCCWSGGVRIGEYTFLKVYVIGYIQPTIWGIDVVMGYVMATVGG